MSFKEDNEDIWETIFWRKAIGSYNCSIFSCSYPPDPQLIFDVIQRLLGTEQTKGFLMSQLNSLALSMASFQRKGKWSWNSRFDRIGLANCGTICMEEQPKGLEIEAAFSCMFKKWWTSKSARPVFCTSDWIPISSKNSPGKFSCFCYIQRFNFWPFRKELLNHTHHHRLFPERHNMWAK